MKKQQTRNVLCFILFCRITCDPFCSVEINTVVKNTFAKERHFADNRIPKAGINYSVTCNLFPVSIIKFTRFPTKEVSSSTF